jgi:hypothetical protein
MTSLTLFVSTFATVFFLGLQSLFVNHGWRTAAFCNSLCIGTASLALYKLTPGAQGIEIAAFLAGGPFGIVGSMVVFRKIKLRMEK